MVYLRLIRWQNLLMILVIQGVIQYVLLAQGLLQSGKETQLSLPMFLLLSLATVCVAASGYVINDVFDAETDKVNKPEMVIIPERISKSKALFLYLAILLAGAVFTLVLSLSIGKPLLALLYPASALILYFYSAQLKGRPLIGNIIVSLFCAGVILLPYLAEIESGISDAVKSAIWGYAMFAALSTFFREVVKDMEDYKGDSVSGAITLPVKYGFVIAKSFAFVSGVLLIASLAYWYSGLPGFGLFSGAKTGIFLLVIIQIYLLVKLLIARSDRDFHQLSTFVKYYMLAGTALLFFL